MKLVELVKYLVEPELLNELYQEKELDKESEALVICMQGTIDMESEIAIFEIEKTGGDLIFEMDGKKYVELFTIGHTIDLIEYDLQLKDNGYSAIQIAERLIDYRLNDA